MGLYPKNLKEFVALCGVPRAYNSKVFIVDTEHGDDDNLGTSFDRPLLTLLEAEERCTGDRHDTVLFVARDTADDPTEQVVWDKDYTHLIGVGCELPGLGQRCRVVHAAATALDTPVVAFSGNGCMVKNMQFGNEYTVGAMGVVSHAGKRCLFENVFFMVPFGVTAASYSLKLSGGENVFKRCTIGQQTCVRSGASRGLWVHKGTGDQQRNKFIDCEFLSWSSNTTHVLVYTDIDIDNEGFMMEFENCLLANLYGSGEAGGKLAVAIDDNCAVFHQILMRGQNNSIAGCTAVADPLTYVLKAEASGTASGLLMALVAEN
jgi:hypothetical protein